MFGAKDNEQEEPCENGQSADDCEAEQDQCPMVPGGALKALFVISPVVVLVNIHFAFVLFTHWKNSSLPEDQGGINEPGVGHVEFDDDE